MKRLIWEPGDGEDVVDGNVTVTYKLPVANVDVCDAIVPNDHNTEGTIFYDSTVLSVDEEGHETIAKNLDEPFVHHFAGWER